MSVAAISAFATDSASRNRGFFKTYLAIGAAICLTAIVQTQLQTEALVKLRTRYKWALLMAAFALNAALALVVVLRRERDRDLWGMLPVSDIMARSDVDAVETDGGEMLAPEVLVDTRDWVRPSLRGGRPVLVVRREAERWVPCERRSKDD